MKDTISIRQVGVLMILCIFANKILLLPSLMYETSKADSLWIILFLFAIDLLVLTLIFKLKTIYPTTKLYDILQNKIGKILTKIIYLILLVFFMFKALLVFSVTYVYFKHQIYKQDLIWIALISCLPVINHAVMCGARGFSRTMELFIGIVLTGFIACLAFSLFTPISMPYFFVSQGKDLLTSCYRHLFSFGDYIFLLLIIDKIEFKRGDFKRIYKYAFSGIILMLLLFFLFYSKYQVTAFMHNNALADLLVFSVEFNAVGRLDIIAMLTILFITLFQLEIFCYGFCESIRGIFPLLKKFYATVTFDIIFGLLYYIFIGKFEIMVTSASHYLPILAIVVNYALPILILIIYLIDMRKVKKNRENVYISQDKISKNNQNSNLSSDESNVALSNQDKASSEHGDKQKENSLGENAVILKNKSGLKGGEYEIKD